MPEITEEERTTLIPTNPNSRNGEGPSWRKILFGTDSKLKPAYSEKNRNNFGIFSSTEIYRQSMDKDEYIMPTRTVGFWSSSCYDHDAGSKPSADLRARTKTGSSHSLP